MSRKFKLETNYFLFFSRISLTLTSDLHLSATEPGIVANTKKEEIK